MQVSKSLTVLDNTSLKLIENATVKISEENILLDSILDPDEDGLYRSEIAKPLQGKQYHMEVFSPDFGEPLYASGKVPLALPIIESKVYIIDSSSYSESVSERSVTELIITPSSPISNVV